MGAEFQPCKDVGTLASEGSRKGLHRPQIQTIKNDGVRLKLCASSSCIPAENNTDLYLKFMENRTKMPTEIKNPSSMRPSSDSLTPKIRHSRVDLGNRKARTTVDANTIRRREALGRMLAQKLGLNPSTDLQLSSAERQNKQRLSDIVQKICINNQEHLIDIIDRMENSFRGSQTRSESSGYQSKLQRFLDSVSKTELDFLDMLYHNDEELYQKGLGKLQFNRNVNENIVDIKQMMMEEKEFPGSAYLSYEKFKSRGLEMIQNQKVCFFVLAGGKSSRYLLSGASDQRSNQSSNPQSYRESVHIPQHNNNSDIKNKDFVPLNIPSQRCIIELIIHRFIALAELLNCHITLYLGISPDKISNLKEVFQKIAIDQEKITIFPFAQKVIGALDYQGNLVVEDGGEASLWSIGTGDIWNIMRGDKELSFPSASELIEKGFQYLQVFGTSNVLEKCFDCFSLGLAHEYDLDWTTKIVESYAKRHNRSTRSFDHSQMQNVETKIFINNEDEIYVCDPQEIDNYPEECRFTFMNNSLFKLKYLQSALQSPELENLWPRKKVHLTNNLPPFSKYRKVNSYEKDYTDIFRLATVKTVRHFDHCSGLSGLSRVQSSAKWRLILCDQVDFYPLIYKKGHHSDIQYASKALTDLHRTYLGIQNPSVRIEIDPYISLEGQRLQGLKKDLEEQSLEQDQWIFIQRN